MEQPICRVAVHMAGAGTDIDLVLPGDAEVGALLPDIVELTGPSAPAPDAGTGWLLTRAGGEPLCSGVSLSANGVRDGDLLVLRPQEGPVRHSVIDEPARLVADSGRDGPDSPWVLPVAAASAAAVGAAVLCSAGLPALPAAAVVLVAAMAVVVAQRREGGRIPATAAAIAVMFAAAGGFITVPGGSGADSTLLGAAAAATTAMLTLRLTGRQVVLLTALGTAGALVAVATAADAVWSTPGVTVGAVLAVAALMALNLSARLAMAVTGLAVPGTLDHDGGPDGRRAVLAHEVLTGAIGGSAASAAAGVVLVAASSPHPDVDFAAALAFCAAVAAALLLRTRLYPDPLRRLVMLAAGMLSAAAGVAVVAVRHPGAGPVLGAVVALTGLVVLVVAPRAASGPLAGRAADLAEYAALAAVAPLACWLAGLYHLVAGLGL